MGLWGLGEGDWGQELNVYFFHYLFTVLSFRMNTLPRDVVYKYTCLGFPICKATYIKIPSHKNIKDILNYMRMQNVTFCFYILKIILFWSFEQACTGVAKITRGRQSLIILPLIISMCIMAFFKFFNA